MKPQEISDLLYKLVDEIDNKYRRDTHNNIRGREYLNENIETVLLEIKDSFQNSFNEIVLESYMSQSEEKYPFRYFHLRQHMDWITFCDLTGVDHYCIKEDREPRQESMFYIKHSDAIKFNLIKNNV